MNSDRRISKAAMQIEFRSRLDDAWYHVRTAKDGDRLRVKFIGFSDDNDEVYDAKELTSFRDVDEFASRFRPISIQVQDSECSQLVKATLVCAAVSIAADDCRFYDAVVDQVVHKEHQLVNGKEECLCNFILFWRHGPYSGSLTYQSLENICRVQPATYKLMDALLATFLETARKKITTALSSILEVSHVAPHHTDPSTPGCGEELTFSKHPKQDTSVSRKLSSHSSSSNGFPYMLLVENLEKGLSPFTIVEFIQQQVSVSCQVSVWPSKSDEFYTRGAIVVDCKSNMDKISDFLENPDHIIVSSKGRPWVMTEKSPLHETLRESIRSFSLMSQKILQGRSTVTSSALRVVISGTKEYERAKLLKDLILEFVNHQSRLHQELLIVERKILRLSDGVKR